MELSKLEQLVDLYCSNTSDSRELVEEIASALRKHDVKLFTIVEKLGWLLSSDDSAQRNIGLTLLVQVLEEAGHDGLSEQEVSSLLTFFCSRLSDHHNLLPITLHGLVLLSAFPKLKESEVQTIAKSIFSEVNAAAQLQEDRRKIYLIFGNLLDNHISSLQLMGSEFLLSYIQTMDGERDPRCLLMAFRIVTVLAKHFELGEHLEDLFEVVACYFPVDFRAPADDPFGVSREELSEALEECLVSTSVFAPLCLPLLLEKLTSDLDVAKRDALRVLERCASSYGSFGLKSNLKNIWSAIRREIFSGKDEQISTASLKSLTAIVSSLSEEDCGHFLEAVWKECSQVIRGDSELSVVSASILKAAISGSGTNLRKHFLDKVVVHMTQVLKESDGPQRLSHLQSLSVLLDVPPVGPPASWNCCEDCWSLLISLLSPEHDSVHSQNINGYCWLSVERLLRVGSTLPELETVPLVQRIFSQVANNKSTSTTKNALIGTCSALCVAYPDVSKTRLLPGLLEQLSKDDFVSDVLAGICSSCPSFSESSILNSLMNTFSGIPSHELALRECLVSLVHTGGDDLDRLSELYLIPLVGTILLDVYEEKMDILDRPLYKALEALVAALSPQKALEVSNNLLQAVVFNQAWEKWKGVTPKCFESLPSSSQRAVCQILRSVLPHSAAPLNPCPFQNVIHWLISKSDFGSDVAQTVAGLANKCVHCGKTAFELIEKSETNSNTVLCLIWLTKGLLLSSHPNTAEATRMLLHLLGDQNHGQQVARGFETILSPATNVLNPSSHARIILFYAQRFFALTSASLLDLYQNTENDTRRNYLSALCCQLKYLPLPVLKQELPKLLPVLVATLEQRKENNNQELLLSSVDALGLLLAGENAKMVFSHLSSIIPRLTELASTHSAMQIRIGALKCLQEFTNLPTEQILIYSTDVVQALKSCLDDKKRLVRKEATRAATRWHLVGMEN